MKPRPVILDVDAGVDDALAIMLALRSPELEVKGILTVSGNVQVSQTTTNTLTVLDLLEAPPIAVAAGAAATGSVAWPAAFHRPAARSQWTP